MNVSAPAPIAVVGNINLDVKTSPLPAGPAVLADGETSVGEIYETLGGGGANTAAAAARMGGHVHFCGAIGKDALAKRLADFLDRCAVKPHLAAKDVPTGRSLALNWSHHQRHFLSCLPSSLLLQRADIDIASLAAAGCRHLYRADIWFAPGMIADGNLDLLRDARRHGMRTSIDVNWDPHWQAGRDNPRVAERIEHVARLLPETTFVHGNQRELCFFAGATTLPDASTWFFSRGAATLIVHLGAEGSAAISADGSVIRAPAEPIDHVVSETATGDVFTAAFLLRDGMDLKKRLAESNAAAASHMSGRADYLPRLDS